MRWTLVFLAFAAGSVFAQPNGILLIARPGMPDPNFSETVVLVTWTEDSSTVGVILNRPSVRELVDIAPDWPGAADFKQPIYSGGPVMRQVLVDYARARAAQKRGPGLQVQFQESLAEAAPVGNLLELDQALERLSAEDPRLVVLIEMRFFAGMTAEETAQVRSESVNVVRHDLRYAQARLRRLLGGSATSP